MLETMEVLSVPGHTAHDVAYYLAESNAVFTGDTLFAGGCGRVFSGRADWMWKSLCRLRALPHSTRVFGGHDYTEDNLAFALLLEPDNRAVQNRLAAFRRNAASDRPFTPSTIAEERMTNPFFRCLNVEVFSRIRERKRRLVSKASSGKAASRMR